MSDYERAGLSIQPGILNGLKVAALIDDESASAAEIVALFLRESIGAKLIGKPTFGKDTVQRMFPLKNGDVIYLTTSHYLVGNQKVSVGKTKIVPDYDVSMNGAKPAFGDDLPIGLPEVIDPKTDPQLKKAVEVVKLQRKAAHIVGRE